MSENIGWIPFGKTYAELVSYMTKIGKSTVGIQVDFKGSKEYPALCPKGRYLIGNLSTCGAGFYQSGEGTLDNIIVRRYRRVLTAEELN